MSYTDAELEKFNRLKLSVMASADEWKCRQTGKHGSYSEYIDSVAQRHPGSTQVRHFRDLDRKSRLYGLPGLGEIKAEQPVQRNHKPISTAPPVRTQTRTTPPKVPTTTAATSTAHRPAKKASAPKPKSIKPMTQHEKEAAETALLTPDEKRTYAGVCLLSDHKSGMDAAMRHRDHTNRFGNSGRGEILEA